jgi:UDP-3-O-[3-hydroxymyristoyl] glucosamine N-acyltransferase LpxD
VKSMDKEYKIVSASYAGKPISNTAMYISKKVERLLTNLYEVENCLVFCEESIDIPSELSCKHNFIKTPNPQLEYAKFVKELALELEEKRKIRKYTLNPNGYYVGENVRIGSNALIEPFCFIDHDVVIGDNARIFSGAKIRNAIIGDNFIANENSTIGTYGFTMANDENGNKVRIPTLGKVIIGDNVEIGMLANISVGSAGNTTIGDFVKVDAFVHIAHDVTLENNVEIPAGAIIGGFDTLKQNVFIGINSTLRNRITIGENSIVGMGSVVTKNVPDNTTVLGNPARQYEGK